MSARLSDLIFLSIVVPIIVGALGYALVIGNIGGFVVLGGTVAMFVHFMWGKPS